MANSVVTKDIPPYTIFGGVPAKFIKNRMESYNLGDINLKSMTTEEIVENIKLGNLI